jgi:hypothetical protein
MKVPAALPTSLCLARLDVARLHLYALTMWQGEHRLTEQRFGASVFWVRPAMLLHESLATFLAHWQLKRDGCRRGIAEVVP